MIIKVPTYWEVDVEPQDFLKVQELLRDYAEIHLKFSFLEVKEKKEIDRTLKYHRALRAMKSNFKFLTKDEAMKTLGRL